MHARPSAWHVTAVSSSVEPLRPALRTYVDSAVYETRDMSKKSIAIEAFLGLEAPALHTQE